VTDPDTSDAEAMLANVRGDFEHWEVIKDLTDELIDLMLNYRQSGHPGGSRSKVHLLTATLLSGAMKWDILRPWRPFQDRLVLAAGHTAPLVYASLAILNEAFRERHRRTGQEQYAFPDDGKWALTWEDLLLFRRRGGLSGHAEMEGKTLLLKFNTGPSGHGLPGAAGEALALKLAGLEQIKVFVLEGEGGLTPGSSHETKNSSWGLGLSNLVVLVDWNDFGIDDQPISSVVHGTPETWFKPYGWRVLGTEQGMEWEPVAGAILQASRGDNPGRTPTLVWAKTRKGRGYDVFDNKSHGTPHPINSPQFWTVRKRFMEKYGVRYEGCDEPAAPEPEARTRQLTANLNIALEVLRRDKTLADYISGRLLELARQVPDAVASFNLGNGDIFRDERLYDFRNYPASLYRKPGEMSPNRAGLAAWGAWVNAFAKKHYGRPLVIACSADLADSTSISGFAKDFEDLPGWGRYRRDESPRGTLLPQEITEFANAGIMAGLATVNLADEPFRRFNGFWGSCSTYGSFAYLKYGPFRLFSQLAQDCQLKLGKVIWILSHSGPETADDSRTHFGVFAPGVTQLFPEGQIIDLHPWEHNEVPVVLGASLRLDIPLVALHLTRPAIPLPDREALGIASHFEASRGAYLIRDHKPGSPATGTVFVQGTSTTNNVVKILPELDRAGLNVKVVATISPQLFRMQDEAYRDRIASLGDRWDAMCVTNRALRLMQDWIANPVVAEYSLSSDWDNRWRTGGTVDDILEEAHLTPRHILAGIERFVREREKRLKSLRRAVEAMVVRRL